MEQLHQKLSSQVIEWRSDQYFSGAYPAIAEILDWAHNEGNDLRFLRKPQLNALEIYWYLRLVEKTSHVLDLYRKYYSKQSELLAVLGLDHSDIKSYVLDGDGRLDRLWQRIKTDDAFVRDFKLESLRETLSLDYSSYILALAMGSGKTILIGSIIATEFAMALEYPEGPFVQNALVFAPGKTIIESLRELTEIPYDKILPPRMNRMFLASMKLTFTRDGEKDIPVIRGSSFNAIVTNTEKIRIQKETIRKSDLGNLFSPQKEEEARSEVANLRLQTIASLPHLAVFSDEAHHTYGQSLGDELKKVRKTVDYLAGKTNLVCAVNTTGTPYYQRQSLKDVVVWYGLSDGIKEGILKDPSGNIQAYDFEGDAGSYVAHVIEDFFKDYAEVRLPNGSHAKLAIYFPQTDDLRELKPVIESALIKAGQPAVCLVNTSDETLTKPADIDAFNRLNDPSSPHRVILLVNKGTEGWNCPSLFACALARKLKSSNNFVLQATTRCLRQVPGNSVKARIYLSSDNYNILDRQLGETYGETIAQLNHAGQETRRTRIVLRKLDLPPMVIMEVVHTVMRKEAEMKPIRLERPLNGKGKGLVKTTYTVAEQRATNGVLLQLGDTVTIEVEPDGQDAYGTSVELAARYRVDLWQVYDEIKRLYGGEDIPSAHLPDLARQIEKQTSHYEVREEKVERALALVKPEGFTKEIDPSGAEIYTAEIVYPKDREHLLVSAQEMSKGNNHDFGFHYNPYNFDSNPEKSFFEQMLAHLNLKPEEVEDIYFTGALTDPSKTDFYVEYKDEKGKWRRYTPDFLIRKKSRKGGRPGKIMIVEIKSERDRQHPIDGETGKKAVALRRWEKLNPDRLKYEMIFTAADTVTADQISKARHFVSEEA